MKKKQNIRYSYYRIRKAIGLLGILLPVLVVAAYGEILPSISHYYYTRSAVFFIAILTAFGLFLITYKGYERDKTTEKLSDNLITHIAGASVLLVVLIPTACAMDSGYKICNLCILHGYPLFGHSDKIFSAIHLLSAGLFLFAMGYMSVKRFTKSGTTVAEQSKGKRRRNRLYLICGLIVWISLGILVVEFIMQNFFPGFYITESDVLIFETTAVFAFGISWLVKGEALKDLDDLTMNIRNWVTKPSDENISEKEETEISLDKQTD